MNDLTSTSSRLSIAAGITLIDIHGPGVVFAVYLKGSDVPWLYADIAEAWEEARENNGTLLDFADGSSVLPKRVIFDGKPYDVITRHRGECAGCERAAEHAYSIMTVGDSAGAKILESGHLALIHRPTEGESNE